MFLTMFSSEHMIVRESCYYAIWCFTAIFPFGFGEEATRRWILNNAGLNMDKLF